LRIPTHSFEELGLFGLAPLTDPERRDLLEVIEDRHGATSIILTSQLPIENWHE
jgi:DNA replication protein DnaC